MTTLVMMSGLPASGKSTEACKIISKDKTCLRVSRDSLREMLYDTAEWSKEQEMVTVALEQIVADAVFRHGFNPVIDDTNLTERSKIMWKEFATKRGMKFREIPMTPSVTLEELYAISLRDRARQKSVGTLTIHWMALMNGLIRWPNKPIVICDLDGTLCDGSHRLPYIQQEPKNYHKFYDHQLILQDKVVEPVAKWISSLIEDHTLILISGRPMDRGGPATIEWLKKHNIHYHAIFLRQGKDFREDHIVKEEFLAKLPKDKIAFAIEDRLQVVNNCWRKNGVKVYQVSQNDGNY